MLYYNKSFKRRSIYRYSTLLNIWTSECCNKMRYCNNTTSECALDTVTAIPSLIYIIYIIILVVFKYNSNNVVYSSINNNNSWNRQEIVYFSKPSHYNYLIVVVFLLALLSVLIIVFSCDDTASGSLVLAVTTQSIAWILLTVNIVKESWYIYLWPSNPIKLFISMYIVIYLLVTAIKREGSNNDKMIIESLEQSSLFVVTLIILLIILVKNYYYQDNIDDDVKIRRYFSEDIENNNSNNNNNNSNNNNNNSIYAKILDLFKRNSFIYSANGDDGGRSSFTHSVEKFYGRVFPSSFWTSSGDDGGKDYSEPLLDNAQVTSNDPLDANSIVTSQVVSNGKEMSQTLMKHLIDSKTKNVLDVAPKNNKSSSQGNDRNDHHHHHNYLIVSVIKWGFRKRYLSSDGNKDSDISN